MKRKPNIRLLILTCCLLVNSVYSIAQQTASDGYADLHQKLCKGWNTWSYGSMTSHVLLPEGLNMKINLRQGGIGTPRDSKFFLHEFVVNNDGLLQPLAHSFDGSYTELIVNDWKGNTIRIQSAALAENNVAILVTPESKTGTPYTVELETGIMWNKSGILAHKGTYISAEFGNSKYEIRSTQKEIQNIYPYLTPSIICYGGNQMGFYTGSEKSLETLKSEIEQAKQNYLKHAEKYGDKAEAFLGIETALGWNTLYDIEQNRIITPVTRGWNEAWQGYVLFGWDTYFASLLYSLDNKDFAYSTALSITNGNPKCQYIENVQWPGSIGGEARMTQPPVGSMVCWMIYEKYQEKWFLTDVYNKLLSWNRWWIENRLNKGYLAWGADSKQMAVLESGLDNSPMWEDISMVKVGSYELMNLADVGLNSMYVMDCQYLAKFAKELGKTADEKELLARAETFKKQVQKLWSEKDGIFLNKYTDTEKFSERLSPTLFYPMLAGIPTKAQADRMLKEHYFNTAEFYGKYIIPSCARNDKSFDNQYWRGAIWGPMNLLVYMGLKNYDANAASELASKSYSMYLKAWSTHHLIIENMNSEVGVDNMKDQVNADPLYHWGALMGIMEFLENK